MKRRIIFIGIIILTVLLNVLSWNSTVFSDFYIAHIFPVWVNTYGRLTGLFPFSVGEWLIGVGVILVLLAAVLAIVTLVVWIIALAKKKSFLKWKAFVKGFYQVFAWTLLIVCLVMTLNCFMLYQGSTFSQKYFGEVTSDYSLEDLLQVRNHVVEQCNDLSLKMQRNADGTIIYAGSVLQNGETADMGEKAVEVMQSLGKTYAQLDGYYPGPKPLLSSDFMCQQYMLGYYFPFSMEANYNDVMYIMNKPVTMCHELSHLRGFIFEDEANFISYLACVESDDDFFRYSGYLSVLSYLENDLYSAKKKKPEAFKEATSKIPLVKVLPQVYEDDVFVLEEEWDRINEKAILSTETVDEASDVFIDTTLKLNGVSDGKLSYNRVVELLLKYYEGSFETVAETQKELKYPLLATSETISTIDFVIDSEGIYCVCDGSKFGYLTETGEEISACVYDYAAPFHEGIACVSKDGKYGFIDKTGATVIPFVYDDASPFVEGMAYFAQGDVYGFMDKKGTPVFYLDCDSVSSFQEGLAYVNVDGKYGYINQQGQMVIEPIYDDADYFEDGLAVVAGNGLVGLIDKQGREIIPLSYDHIEFKDSLVIAQLQDMYTCFNRVGEKLFEISYDAIYVAENSYIIKKDDKYGLIDIEGNVLINFTYDYLSPIPGKELLIAKKDDLYGVIDFQENIQIPINYDYISEFIDGQAVVTKEGLYGIIKENGEIVVPIEYDAIRILEDGSITRKEDDITYLYNNKRELIYSGEANNISFEGEFYQIYKRNNYTFLDKNGKEILSVDYDYSFSNIYNGYDVYVLTNYDAEIKESILKIKDTENNDLSDVLLKNKITPKNKLFCEMNEKWDFCNLETKRLYGYDGDLILYYYAEPYINWSFPMSSSGFYTVKDNELQILVTGYECGGSARGDYVHFWYDKETGRFLMGSSGSAGGFGGSATYSTIYEYKNGVAEEILSYEWFYQTSGNYSEEDLLQKAYLLYDEKDNPYTKETVLEAEMVTEYRVNEVTVTKEEYEKAVERYERKN